MYKVDSSGPTAGKISRYESGDRVEAASRGGDLCARSDHDHALKTLWGVYAPSSFRGRFSWAGSAGDQREHTQSTIYPDRKRSGRPTPSSHAIGRDDKSPCWDACVYQQLAHSSAGTHRKIGVGRSCCGIGQSESDKVACLRNFPFCQGADIDEKA